MNFLGSELFSQHSTSFDEDIGIKTLLLSHDPDGHHFDSEQLLHAMENIMLHATALEDNPCTDATTNQNDNEVFGSDESLGKTIYRISCEIQCKCSDEGDLHRRTMLLFDLLGKYRWDAKVVLVLAAFATSYGEFWLLMQLYPSNPVAVSVAMLKHLPKEICKLKPQFKALRLLVKSMVDVTKCIIKFEGLPFQRIESDDDDDVVKAIAKSDIYVAAYWVVRSALICSSQIAELTLVKPEKVSSNLNLNSTTLAAWELSSLLHRLGRICKQLRQHVEVCSQQIETKLHQKLLNICGEKQLNNQEVLHLLLALKDDLPLKKFPSQAKLGISELINKVVILLITKPELLSIEGTLFLVQQTNDHPRKATLQGKCEIVWVPISLSISWTDAEEKSFNFLSNSLPWYSIRKPWSLNSAVLTFIKEAWNYSNEPIMVVLDSNGKVTNSNALDMVFIWGANAYPFSASREQELWEEQTWTMKFLIDEINPLLTKWVEEDKHLCIYGSESLRWVQEFTHRMKEIKKTGVKLEIIYVGVRNPSQQVKAISAFIDEDNISTSLSFMHICFFWLRLESIKRSKLRLEKITSNDQILEELSSMLDINENDKGWLVIGKGSSPNMVKLQGTKHMECLNLFPTWAESVSKLGFLGALRAALEPSLLSGPCGHSNIIPYAEGLVEESEVCDKCKSIMKKFVIFE